MSGKKFLPNRDFFILKGFNVWTSLFPCENISANFEKCFKLTGWNDKTLIDYNTLIIFIPLANWIYWYYWLRQVTFLRRVFNRQSRYKTKSIVLHETKEFYSELILQANVFYTSGKLYFVHWMHIFLDTLTGATFCSCFFSA